MAPPQTSKTSAEPTFYEILAITPQHLEGQAAPAQQKVVKQAYRRALLRHHPDKKVSPISPLLPPSSPSSASASASTSKPKSSPPSPSQPKAKTKTTTTTTTTNGGLTFTVDQIQQAYGVLSDRKQRAEYDRGLRQAAPFSSSASPASSSASAFRTGVETVDLDDLGFDGRTGVYHRGCRCGNARGYAFAEEDLDEFEADGVLMVECLDCSLWLRVLFAAAAEDDDHDDDDEEDDVAVAAASSGVGVGVPQGTGIEVRRRGSSAGAGEGKGWKFNWSFNWGISVSGSTTAGTGTGMGKER